MKHVYENNTTDWYVAESVEQAIELARSIDAANGIPESEMDLDFRQTPDDTVLTVAEYVRPLFAPVEKAVKTAAEFAAENEPGFLATTEY